MNEYREDKKSVRFGTLLHYTINKKNPKIALDAVYREQHTGVDVYYIK